MKKRMMFMLSLVVALMLLLSACFDSPVDLDDNDDDDNAAVKYTVTFMIGATQHDAKEVASGAVVTKPSDPNKEGFGFVGWYLTLNADGSGSGTAFNFATPITADTVLHAAFVELDSTTVFLMDSRTVFLMDNRVEAFPQRLFEGGTFVPTGYGNDMYDFGGYAGIKLTPDESGFELAPELEFVDISLEDEVYTSYFDGYVFRNYYDFDTGVDYILYEYEDFTTLAINGLSYYVIHHTYGDITIIIATDGDNDNSYVIIDNDGVSVTYEVVSEDELGDTVNANEAFFNNYVYNGVTLLYAAERSLKSDYLEVHIHIGMSMQTGMKKGETINLDFLNDNAEEDQTIELLYDSLEASDDELIGLEYFTDELTTALIALVGVDDLDGALDDIIDEHHYSIGYIFEENGKITAGISITHDPDHWYYSFFIVEIVDNKITLLQCNINNNEGYSIYYLKLDGTEWATYVLVADKLFDGTLPSEEFDIFMLLGIQLNLRANWISAE